MKRTIIIADKYPMSRIGLKSYFENTQFNVVSLAETGSSAYSEIIKHKPDFAILDYNLPDLNGLDLALLCKKHELSTKIIIFTNSNMLTISNEIGKSIDGYILKDDDQDTLLNCLEEISYDNTYISCNVIRSKKISSEIEIKEHLSYKEFEILKLVSHGKSSQEISGQLHISRRTIEKHRSAVIKKLDIDSTQFGLIQWAQENFETING